MNGYIVITISILIIAIEFAILSFMIGIIDDSNSCLVTVKKFIKKLFCNRKLYEKCISSIILILCLPAIVMFVLTSYVSEICILIYNAFNKYLDKGDQ